MTASTSERREQAFFTALAETGSQTIYAERAQVCSPDSYPVAM